MANQGINMPRRPLSRAPFWSCSMIRKVAILAMLLMLVPVVAVAQTDKPAEGKVSGNYNVQQAIEVGGRLTDINGNASSYNTLENLHSGPRLLEYTLQMRSLNHTGSLIDDLYTSSFGYGGDPNAVTRLRISKNKWYDFTGMFRRDQYYFDYNLIANPLNPPNVFVPNNVSPHFQDTRRKMGDFGLTIAPQSPIRIRLGYSRNVTDGPLFTTMHEGTDIGMFTNYEYRSDRYQAGIDVKIAPRTTISFDQFWDHNKTENNLTDAPLRNTLTFDPANPNPPGSALNPGALVNIGVVVNTLYNQPCGGIVAPPLTAGVAGLPNTIIPGCNIYSQFDRLSRTRTDIPTSQLSFHSNYWNKLEITAQGSYGSGELKMLGYQEVARTLVTRTNESAWNISGPGRNKRVEAHADFGLTLHLNDHWSLHNQFRWLNWRIPGTFDSTETACFANLPPPGTAGAVLTANIFTPPGAANGISGTCAGFAAVGVPLHNASSGADFDVTNFIRYLGEASIFNTSTIEWEPAKRFAAHIGYRYGNRYLKDKTFDTSLSNFLGANLPGVTTRTLGLGIVTPSPDDIGTQDITEHSLLAGFRAMPYDGWRVNADLELMSANNAFTQITPRNLQRFKVRSTYRVANWGSVNGSINWLESRNNGFERLWPDTLPFKQGHKDHGRSFQVSFTINPNERFAIDFGYDYADVFSTTGTCVPLTTGAALPGGAPLPTTSCLNFDGTTNGGTLAMTTRYQNNINSGFANLMVKPVKRVTLTLGYDLTSDSGYNNWFYPDGTPIGLVQVPVRLNTAPTVVINASALNPFVPLGPLGVNWHKPSASLAFEVYKGLTAKGAWNNFDYNEKSLPGPVAPRDFHANTGTVSLRYEF